MKINVIALGLSIFIVTAGVFMVFQLTDAAPPPRPLAPVYKLIGWNDLGMHCMNESFANLAVLPPYNTLWAQLIQQGSPPKIITASVTIEYNLIDNTYSACQGIRCKSNFWQYAAQLFPGSPSATQPNAGLTGATLSGTMNIRTDHMVIEGVPVTPYLDSAPSFTPANWYPYQQMRMVAKSNSNGQVLAETLTVAPVSTEMRCDTCHSDGQRDGIATGNVETNILTLHDQEELTTLMSNRPVLCANCHGSNALGAPGNPGLPNLSLAMHGLHGSVTNDCYLCHPGQVTRCLRDIMWSKGLGCTTCHGTMSQVADSNRRPWIDLPRCGNCHGATFAENPTIRYRDSIGHGGLFCEACHGSPHAILPTSQTNDNLQSIALQGHSGTVSECVVCHSTNPAASGPHGIRAHLHSNIFLPLINK